MARRRGRIPARPRLGSVLHGRPLRPRLRLALLASILLIQAGCAGIDAREALLRNAIDDRIERAEASRELPAEVGAVLARHGQLERAAEDPGGAARALEDRLRSRPEPDGALALAELSYRAGLAERGRSPDGAIAWYRDASALAMIALAQPAGSRPDLAVSIHNLALARLIRISQAEQSRAGRPWRHVLGEAGLALGSTSPYLDPERISDVRVAGDLRVQGMDHVYRGAGLGVSLVAHRLSDPTQTGDLQDRCLPRELRTAATAVLMPAGGLIGGEWRRRPSTLMLLDPFRERSLSVGGKDVTLADDRTTSLAAQVAGGHLGTLEWTGLFDSDFEQPGVAAGLYMLRPYEPGKVPVVFVHGLISSPRAWAQTINELRNDPALDDYQVWVFLYPTGLPIPASAARLRASLNEVRETFDPGHVEPALDRMVLVGHSMGGLLSKMMVQDTGLALWDSAMNVPHDRFRASPGLRKGLDEALIFRPLPFVSRVVFIASPHRGSPIADELVGRVVGSLVRRPAELSKDLAEIEAMNGPDVISREMQSQPLNAIGNLRTDSPILAALDRVPIDPRVPYHSIIPLIGGRLATDGVVPYRSSHLEGATSELILAGTHFSQERPEVTRELRRILREHQAGSSAGVGD